MRTGLNFAVAALVLIGCSRSEEVGRPMPEDLTVSKSLSDSAQALSARETVQDAMTTSPEAALDLLLSWDAAGLRFEKGHNAALHELYCFLPGENCLSAEPGWDMVWVVRGYSWDRVLGAPDSAVFSVAFDQLGSLPVTKRDFVPFPQDAVSFRRMEEGWRIVGPESLLRPHISLSSAMVWARSAVDSARVREWLAADARPTRSDEVLAPEGLSFPMALVHGSTFRFMVMRSP